jgi:capsular exopolysaccharide synthesis family protein
MTLEQYWIILVKQWRLIVVCFLLVGVGASLGSRLMTPLYQSTALIQITIRSSSNQADYNSLLASDQLVQTEAILATSDPVLREVASHYRGLAVDQLFKEVTATPKLNTQLFEIDVLDPSPTRAAALANDIATTLIKQQLFLMQQEGGQVDFLHIAQPAQPVFTAVRPDILLNTGVGLLAGLFLGILLAILFERLDTRVRTPEALAQLLEWPLLATIWRATSSNQKEVINPKGNDINIESYRILRTNIGFSAIDKPLHSMLVTSALPRDGKSAIAANLAIFMAKAGKNTLLIDADLRRPTQHSLFGVPANSLGLSNAILAFGMQASANGPSHHQTVPFTSSNQSSNVPITTSSLLEPYVHSVGIPNLWVMPSGPLPPNPSELLDSKAMQRFLKIIENCGVEVAIFDTPPLLGLSDASILASKVDGILVVIDSTRANKQKIKQLKTALTQTNANVLGCVINKQRRNRNDSTYAYYYYLPDQKEGERKLSRNGHIPTVHATPAQSPSLSPTQSDQGMRSN